MSYVRLAPEIKQQIAERYADGETLVSLAVRFGVARGTVHNITIAAGVNRACRVHHFNERYFAEIDSEEKAYWLGFLYADGNVWKNTVGIALSAVDLDHLSKVTTAIEAKVAPRYRESNDSWVVKFNSCIMVNDLAQWGLVPAKSHIIKTPAVSNGLLRHFYRGYFDGDGWISCRKRSKTWSVGVVSGSRDFVEDIRGWLGGQIGSKAKIVDKKKARASQIVFEGNGICRRAVEILYGNATVYLERKHKLAMEIMK